MKILKLTLSLLLSILLFSSCSKEDNAPPTFSIDLAIEGNDSFCVVKRSVDTSGKYVLYYTTSPTTPANLIYNTFTDTVIFSFFSYNTRKILIPIKFTHKGYFQDLAFTLKEFNSDKEILKRTYTLK